jgi:branched-subunit amino acid permease
MLLGLGFALFSAPNTNSIMSSVPPKNRGEASGMIAVVRQLGMMTSMGIAMCCITLIMGTVNRVDLSTYDQFIQVIQAAFTICLIMCVIGTLFSWFRGDTSAGKMG